MIAWLNSLWLIIAISMAFFSCACLAISQPNHFRSVTGGSLSVPQKRQLRWVGWTLLFLSLAACILRDGVSFAVLLWPLLFAVSSFAVAMLLAYKPDWLKGLSNRITRFIVVLRSFFTYCACYSICLA